MLLFIAQTALFASHRLAAHRREGIRSLFLPIPIVDMVPFATFVTAALVLRRKKGHAQATDAAGYISIIIGAVASAWRTSWGR